MCFLCAKDGCHRWVVIDIASPPKREARARCKGTQPSYSRLTILEFYISKVSQPNLVTALLYALNAPCDLFFKDIRLSTNQWRARLLWGNLTLWRIIRLKSVYISLLRLDIVIRRQVFFFFLFLKLIHFKAFKIPSITQVKRSRSACGFA